MSDCVCVHLLRPEVGTSEWTREPEPKERVFLVPREWYDWYRLKMDRPYEPIQIIDMRPLVRKGSQRGYIVKESIRPDDYVALSRDDWTSAIERCDTVGPSIERAFVASRVGNVYLEVHPIEIVAKTDSPFHPRLAHLTISREATLAEVKDVACDALGGIDARTAVVSLTCNDVQVPTSLEYAQQVRLGDLHMAGIECIFLRSMNIGEEVTVYCKAHHATLSMNPHHEEPREETGKRGEGCMKCARKDEELSTARWQIGKEVAKAAEAQNDLLQLSRRVKELEAQLAVSESERKALCATINILDGNGLVSLSSARLEEHAARSARGKEKIDARLAELARMSESGECVVCVDRPKTRFAIPCGHACACASCAPKLDRCPVCRAHVLAWQPVFF